MPLLFLAKFYLQDTCCSWMTSITLWFEIWRKVCLCWFNINCQETHSAQQTDGTSKCSIETEKSDIKRWFWCSLLEIWTGATLLKKFTMKMSGPSYLKHWIKHINHFSMTWYSYSLSAHVSTHTSSFTWTHNITYFLNREIRGNN